MPGIRFRCQLMEYKFDVWWFSSTHHSIRMLRSLIHERVKQLWPQHSHQTSTIKLFFNGQQLDDRYSIRTYEIADDHVIQIMLTTIQSSIDNYPLQTIETETTDDIIITKDEYYSVGDHVDAFIPETGSWSPAQIMSIIQTTTTTTTNDQIKYCVSYRKSTLNSSEQHCYRCLSQIRPQPYRLIMKEMLEPGQCVMVYDHQQQQWYMATVESTRRSRRNLSMRVWLAIVCHGLEMPITRHQCRYRDGHFYHLESNVKFSERSNELNLIIKNGSPINRFIEPDCKKCNDNVNVTKCSKCGCQSCWLKGDPDKQLVCDECERSFHIWCLQQPLNQIPDDDYWYCDECRNETNDDLFQQQHLHLQQRQQASKSITNDKWGYGMACVARSKYNNNNHTINSATFGAISGVPVGSWWRFRVQASEAGVHAPLMAGIHGSEQFGAYSLVFAQLNPQDVDLGDEIYFTAKCHIIRNKKSNNKIIKNQQQQQLKRETLALAKNCPVPVNEQHGANANVADNRNLWKQGLPIRVLRSGNNRIPKGRRSRFLPKIGVRYDGLYKVVSYWPEIETTNGNRIWRFLLRRDDNEPAPWTNAGRYRTKKFNLRLQYPAGWCQQVAQKRYWKKDAAIIAKQQNISTTTEESIEQTVNNYRIPLSLIELIENDHDNKKIWTDLLAQTYRNSREFRSIVQQTFRCVCCLETLDNDDIIIITTQCSHNFCQQCLNQYIESCSSKNKTLHCPLCRSNRFLTKKSSLPKPNDILKEILIHIKSSE